MANQDDEVSLPDLANAEAVPATAEAADETSDDEELARTAHDLEAVFDVPVNVSAVLGKTQVETRSDNRARIYIGSVNVLGEQRPVHSQG